MFQTQKSKTSYQSVPFPSEAQYIVHIYWGYSDVGKPKETNVYCECKFSGQAMGKELQIFSVVVSV